MESCGRPAACDLRIQWTAGPEEPARRSARRSARRNRPGKRSKVDLDRGRLETVAVPQPSPPERDDPYLADLRRICLRLPGAAEKISHGRPCFFTKNIFAIYGATTKGDHDSGRYDASVVIRSEPDEAAALLATPHFFVPAYWGPYGWIGMDLTGAGVDWDEVDELVQESFRLTAPKKLVAEVDR